VSGKAPYHRGIRGSAAATASKAPVADLFAERQRPERVAAAIDAVRRRAAARAPADAVEVLRSRLAGQTAREHVVLDFLEDDLREVRTALAAVAAWVANVEAALSERAPCQQRLLSLALGGRPGDRIEELGAAVASVRRRLAQVAARM
jgi:hypothetical protein